MKLRKNPLKNEEGFTLIEIIAVLVIMGILAAVAVPKFFDLQSKAREKAIYTAVSELKVRVNQAFSKQLLQGVPVGSIDYSGPTIGTNIGPDFDVYGWDDSGNPILVDIRYKPNAPTLENAVEYEDQEIQKPQAELP
jgi:prepilin-type N-terminal cleavage/methylation domain-containing protein